MRSAIKRDNAIICESGHVINGYSSFQQDNRKYCQDCGGKAISECGNCGEPIIGAEITSGIPGILYYKPPNFCSECGEPQVWTANRIKAVEEYADLLDWLKPEERQLLSQSVRDILANKNTTPVAILKMKQMASKLGKEGMKAIGDILRGAITKEIEDELFL